MGDFDSKTAVDKGIIICRMVNYDYRSQTKE